MNSYTNIAHYYDLLMTSGYYDYDALSRDLQQVITEGDRVLELGVGTGLMAERLLRAQPGISFTGIDKAEAMLQQARSRLNGQATLQLADVRHFESEEPFDVVFSCGGVWYFVNDDGEMQLCSHIPDPEVNRAAFSNVLRMLRPGGSLVLSIQGVHSDYERRLDDDVVYRQRIHWDGDSFCKEYVFEGSREIAVQRCRYLLLRHAEMEEFFAATGLQPVESPLRQFRLFTSAGVPREERVAATFPADAARQPVSRED